MAASCAINPTIQGKVPPYASNLLNLLDKSSAFAFCDSLTTIMNDNPNIFLVDANGVPTMESIRDFVNMSKLIYENATQDEKLYMAEYLDNCGAFDLNVFTLSMELPQFQYKGEKMEVVTDINIFGRVEAKFSDKRMEDYFFSALNKVSMSVKAKNVLSNVVKGSASKLEAALRIAKFLISDTAMFNYISKNDIDLINEFENIVNSGVLKYLSNTSYFKIDNKNAWDTLPSDYSKHVLSGENAKRANEIIGQVKEKMKSMTAGKILSLRNCLSNIYGLSALKDEIANLLDKIDDKSRSAYEELEKLFGDTVMTFLRRQSRTGEYVDRQRKNEDEKTYDEKNKKHDIAQSIMDPRYSANETTQVLSTFLSRYIRDMENTAPAFINDVIEKIKASGAKTYLYYDKNNNQLFFDVPKHINDYLHQEIGVDFNNLEILISEPLKADSTMGKLLLGEHHNIHSLKKNTRAIKKTIEPYAKIELDNAYMADFVRGTLANHFQLELVRLCEAFYNLNAVDNTMTDEALQYMSGQNRYTGNKAVNLANKALNAYSVLCLGFNYSSAISNGIQYMCNGLIAASARDNIGSFAKSLVRGFISALPRLNTDYDYNKPETLADYAFNFCHDTDTNFGLEEHQSLFNRLAFFMFSGVEKITRSSSAILVLSRKNIEMNGKMYSFADLTKKYKHDDMLPAFKLNGVDSEPMTLYELSNVLTPSVDSFNADASGFSSKMFAPVATKTILGKALSIMRRWMIKMYDIRYGSKRYRESTGVEMAGYVRQFAEALYYTIRTGKNQFNKPKNKIAAKMFATEMGIVATATALFAILDFGDDDDDANSKLPNDIAILFGSMYRDITTLAPTPLIYSSAKETLLNPLPVINYYEKFFKDIKDGNIHKQLPIIKQYYQWIEKEERAKYSIENQRKKLRESVIIGSTIGKPWRKKKEREKARRNSSNRRIIKTPTFKTGV